MRYSRNAGLLVIAAICLIIASCGNDKNRVKNEFTIHGKFKNTKGEMLRLVQLTVDSVIPRDSAIIDENGAFSFNVKATEPSFYLLKAAADNFITLLVNPGEIIELSGNFQQLAREYNVSGSPGSALLAELNTHTRSNYRKVDSIENILNKSQDSSRFADIKKEIDSAYNLIFLDQQKFVKTFIDKNDSSLASLMAIYQVFGRVKVLNERDHFESFEKLDKSLTALYPDNGYVLELHNRVLQIHKSVEEQKLAEKKLDSGLVAPDIYLKNIGGVSCNLSSLKGRVVLVWFWAGWSKTSQKDIDVYKFLYKKYRSKGFEIYAVSLDKDRQTWEDAVRGNKMQWLQVGDLLEWNSPVVKIYCLKNLPHALLIGRDGRILKRGITAEQLPDYLAKQFKN
jgi:thiol-disulfide isomerase/thioredoxin